VLAASGAALALTAGIAGGAIAFDPATLATPKPLGALLDAGGVITATRWDAFARTTRIVMPNGATYLHADGAAGSLIPGAERERWRRDVAGFAFAAGGHDRVFLIGSGGGLDAALAADAGAREIVAVELNAAGVALTTGLGADVGYPAATDLRLGEGRRELARDRARGGAPYDVVLLANVVTGAAELRSAAASENRAHTVEAFQEYLAALTPQGHLALALYDEATLTRGIVTAVTALTAAGYAADAAAATEHVAAVLEGRGSRPAPLLLVRRSPWTPEEAIALARAAEARGLALLLIPHLLAPPPLARLAAGESTLDDLIAAGGGVDLRASYDRAPHFFTLARGVPRDARLAALAAAAIAGTLLIASWLRAGVRIVRRRTRVAGSPRRAWRSAAASARHAAIAAALGAGFLAVELHALAGVHAALGHPAWSLALTLGALLTGGAIGAGLAPRGGSVALAAAAAGGAALLVAPASAALHAATLAAPAAGAALTQGTLLLAIGVPLGIPFPRLLRRRRRGVASAWAASALAAVAIGGAAAALTRTFGIPALGIAAAIAYGTAALLALPWHADVTRGDRAPGGPSFPERSNPMSTSIPSKVRSGGATAAPPAGGRTSLG
jgi:YD repeat-containing protein